MAWYTKSLVTSLPGDVEVTVLAERSGSTPQTYGDGRVTVYRCWSYGPSFLVDVLREIRRARPDVVHVQHEVFLYGSAANAAAFPLLLLLIRLSGVPVVVTAHNGIMPLDEVDGDFLKENGIEGPPTVMKFGLKALLRSVVALSTTTVVHEARLRDALVVHYSCPGSKLAVIPHGVGVDIVPMPQDVAKAELGLPGKKVVLFLGYITGYKNVELLIDAAKLSQTGDLVVIVGGGAHPRLANDPKYVAYKASLEERAEGAPPGRVRFVGFIPEDQIATYVSAADLLVFPYKTCMAASGPLAIALSYGRPVLVSEAFEGLAELRERMFPLDPAALAERMDKELAEPEETRLGAWLEERRWPVVARRTAELYRAAAERRGTLAPE